tara:strand:- start:205 stop:567 length:363 start_codon:yes stop_codon:yes gene_type:complete
MNLKQLKKMISEEYRYWLAEQPAEEPGIEVSPNDVDATGGGDSEATLKQIFDMLKDYFEGGAGGEMPAAPVGGEDMGDMDALEAGGDDDVDFSAEGEDEDEEEAEALQERFKKLANIIKG